MRITETMMSNYYIGSINQLKDKIALRQRQISSGVKIEKPSDSPTGAVKVIRNDNQLSQIDTYLKNIHTGLSFLDQTTFALQSIQDEVLNVVGKLEELNNPINQQNMSLYADMIENSLRLMVDVANSKADGKYIFGGTDQTAKPFVYSSDGQTIEQNTKIRGYNKVRISQEIEQRINITGIEIFGTIVSADGTLDKNSSVGTIVSQSRTVYDNLGNEYNLQVNIEKTNANQYQLTYNITDGGGNTIFTSPTAAQLAFNPTTGALETLDGKSPSVINISVPSNRINFNLDLSQLRETDTNQVLLNANQDIDIFNQLKIIVNNLRNGIPPTEEQRAAVNAFNSKVIGKLSEIGNIINQFTTIESMLTQQNLDITENNSQVNGVDVAKAIIELQNQDYLLQLSQKLAATILPKSLLDYL
ncbi:Flagellin-related protein [Ignavibacterium album JCM 16511]|uniref:Flagellin-related protein n=1 Tax=Ignavibacterium album (strain DSM 19864 / JCM 16511 / NBRC 101810 / Mat9-16) TaxID=945713 RepID=I0AMK4_IGNAJ|nr:flagellar hook-associated protein FlgL [Ignavibacterium album]AFH50211.1 Flagellin-related protein [Ignavibacterium album JCM 16511]